MMGLLDTVMSTLNAFNNISFVASLTVCTWVVIAKIMAVSIIRVESPVPKLRYLAQTMIYARLGTALR